MGLTIAAAVCWGIATICWIFAACVSADNGRGGECAFQAFMAILAGTCCTLNIYKAANYDEFTDSEPEPVEVTTDKVQIDTIYTIHNGQTDTTYNVAYLK